jgi:hypothetical protein
LLDAVVGDTSLGIVHGDVERCPRLSTRAALKNSRSDVFSLSQTRICWDYTLAWAMCENDIGRRLGNKKDVDAMLAYGAILRLGTIGPSIG